MEAYLTEDPATVLARLEIGRKLPDSDCRIQQEMPASF